MNRKELLQEAGRIVTVDRAATHGRAEDSFAAIAGLWSSYLDASISSVDVACMMALLKIARIRGNPSHEDNWVDLAGYAACGAEVAHPSPATETGLEEAPIPYEVVDGLEEARPVKRAEKSMEKNDSANTTDTKYTHFMGAAAAKWGWRKQPEDQYWFGSTGEWMPVSPDPEWEHNAMYRRPNKQSKQAEKTEDEWEYFTGKEAIDKGMKKDMWDQFEALGKWIASNFYSPWDRDTNYRRPRKQS